MCTLAITYVHICCGDRCPNPEACEHQPGQLGAAHPFSGTGDGRGTNDSSLWTLYEQQLCKSPAYQGVLCTVCNAAAGFGQTDIFSCDACIGVDPAKGGTQPDGRRIGLLWALYAIGFTVYLLVVLILHLRENPPGGSPLPAASGPDASQRGQMELHFAELFKALAMYLQYLAGAILKLPVSWPSNIGRFAEHAARAWAWVMGSGASIDCLLIASKSSALGTAAQAGLKALINLLAPFVTVVVIMALYVLWWLLRQRVYRRALAIAESQSHTGNSHVVNCSKLLVSWLVGLGYPAAQHNDLSKQNYLTWLKQQSTHQPSFCTYMVDRFVPMLLIAAFFWYPSIARVALGMFACMTVCQKDASFWVMDMRFTCPVNHPGSPQSQWAYGVGIPAVMITAILPLFVLCWLWSHMWELQGAAFKSKFAFMYSDYNYDAESLTKSIWGPNGSADCVNRLRACFGVGSIQRNTAKSLSQAWNDKLGYIKQQLPNAVVVLRHRLILVWDVAVHCTTLLLMICSVYGAYGMHEYYQVLCMCAVFAAYMFAVMLIKPFDGLNQLLQTTIAAVLLATSLGVLVFIPPEGLDARQQGIKGSIETGVEWVLLVVNGVLTGLLMCWLLVKIVKVLWGLSKAAAAGVAPSGSTNRLPSVN